MKNYTSTVDPETTIYRIEQILVRFGACHISKDYEAGEVSGVVFSLRVPDQPDPMFIRLPANVTLVAEHLMKSAKQPPTKDKREQLAKRIHCQAKRTAWKLIQDWVEVQLSLVEMKQAEAAQVFLPYFWNGRTRTTLYDHIKEQRFAALGYKQEGSHA